MLIDFCYNKRCLKILENSPLDWPGWFLYRRGETIAYFKVTSNRVKKDLYITKVI